MTMQEHLDACKRRAFELKATHPDLKHTKRLDLAAQSLGYAHYTALDKMLKLLGPDIAPSRIAILEAGGNAADSPFRLVTSEFGVGWSNKSGVKESVQSPSAADRTGMTEQDVRAVIERCHDLTHFGLGVSRGEIERHGSYRKALDAGQSMLIAHLDECNKALRFLAHVEKRGSINPKAGGSYGLKHSVEYFLRHLKDKPDDAYVANGAFICAALHLGFDYRPIALGSPNAYFNMSQRSPVFEWRKLEGRSSHLYYDSKAQQRYQELRELLGMA